MGSSGRTSDEAEACLASGLSPLQQSDNLKVLFGAHGDDILKVSCISEGKRREMRASRQKKGEGGEQGEKGKGKREEEGERCVCSGYYKLVQRIFLFVYSILIIFLSQKKKREKMPAFTFDFGRSAIT